MWLIHNDSNIYIILLYIIIHCIYYLYKEGISIYAFILMLKVKLQYFGHLMQRANSLEKDMMMGKIKDRRRRR